MKYLKNYRLFESKELIDVFTEITDSLMDIFDEYGVEECKHKVVISLSTIPDRVAAEYPNGYWRYIIWDKGPQQIGSEIIVESKGYITIGNIPGKSFQGMLWDIFNIQDSIEGRIGKSINIEYEEPESDIEDHVFNGSIHISVI